MCQRTAQRVQGQGENELPEGSLQKEHRAGQRGRQEPEQEREKVAGGLLRGIRDRNEKEMTEKRGRQKEEEERDKREGRRTDCGELSGAPGQERVGMMKERRKGKTSKDKYEIKQRKIAQDAGVERKRKVEKSGGNA